MPDEVLEILLVLINVVPSVRMCRGRSVSSKELTISRRGEYTRIVGRAGQRYCEIDIGFADTVRMAVVMLDRFRRSVPEAVQDHLLPLIRLAAPRPQARPNSAN